MNTPTRIQRSRKYKQTSPNGLPIVYVGRPSKWGNPFKVVEKDGYWYVIMDDRHRMIPFQDKVKALECCVDLYKAYISREHNRGTLNISSLKGKNLSCWCSKDSPCHADVLIELAEKLEANSTN